LGCGTPRTWAQTAQSSTPVPGTLVFLSLQKLASIKKQCCGSALISNKKLLKNRKPGLFKKFGQFP
jgi:hypothetical protein